MSHRQIMPPHLTPTTPEQLALYRTEHVIVPQAGTNVSGRDCQVCAVDGIELMRKGFYAFAHSTDAIRRLVRIERGQPEYLEGEWRPAEAWTPEELVQIAAQTPGMEIRRG